MYTECPKCHTFFRIGPEHLKAAGGKVRCGRCNHIFNALDTLTDELPTEQSPDTTDTSQDNAPQYEGTETAEARTANEETTASASEAPAPSEEETPEASSQASEQAPDESEGELIQSTLDDPQSDLEAIFAEDEAEIAKEFGLEEVDAEATANDDTSARDKKAGDGAEKKDPSAEKSKKDRDEDDDFEDWGDLDEPLSTLARTTTVEPDGDTGASRLDLREDSRVDDSALEGDSLLSELEDEDEQDRKGRSTALWGGLIGLLGLILIGQLAYLKRDELSQIPSLRPAVAQLCVLTGCELPPLRDLRAIRIESRDVRSHPERPGALLVNATFVNTADFNQPYPVMRLRFTDIQGRVVAERQFQPAEYLGPDIEVDRGMPPGVPIHIKLEIADPGEEAVSFEFDFI